MKKHLQAELMLIKLKENRLPHPPQKKEKEFYQYVVSGDTKEILRLKETSPPKNQPQETERGILSEDPLRNEIYHMIVNCAIITRLCTEAGLPQEDAYFLSDYYIGKADKCKTVQEVRDINDELALEFANRMASICKREVSPPIRRTICYISDHLGDRLNTGNIAEKVGYNRSYLSTLFRREMGMTISEYMTMLRMEKAQTLISENIAISEVSNILGFSSQSHFHKVFKEWTGYTPRQYRDLTRSPDERF